MMLGLRIHHHHHHHLPATFFISKPSQKSTTKSSLKNIRSNYDYIFKNRHCKKDDSGTNLRPSNWSNNLISLAIAVALITPLPSSAISAFGSKSLSLPSAATPFSQAQNLPTGLEDGKIRPCPSINPGCVSSNPKSSSFAFPWSILGKSTNSSAIQVLRVRCFRDEFYLLNEDLVVLIKTQFQNDYQLLEDAILKTQKNVKLQPVEDTPAGKYLQAEVDGGFGRDVLEFLVNGNVVAFRAMATKVTYVYPFTTAIGDSRGQEERMKKIVNELGWYAPSFDSMD